MVAKVLALQSLPQPRGAAVPPAFERLFEREYARVVRIAQRVLGDTGEAEDVRRRRSCRSTGRIPPKPRTRRPGCTRPLRTPP